MSKCPLCMTFHGKYINAGSDNYWGECEACEQYIREYYNKNRIELLSEEKRDELKSELKSARETSTHSPHEIEGGGGPPPENNLSIGSPPTASHSPLPPSTHCPFCANEKDRGHKFCSYCGEGVG